MVTLTDNDVLTSPALPVLCELAAAGVRFRLVGNQVLVSPRGALSPQQREVFANHGEAVRVLVAVVTDEGVQARRDLFRHQLDVAPAGTVPAFLFAPNVAYVKGMCFSCADRLPEARFSRCWRCSLAWRLACRLPIPSEYAEALDGAKVLA